MEKIQLVLVDDELSSRNTIKKYLEENDIYEIIADFKNGKTALDWLRKNSVDILLCDMQMPVLSEAEYQEAREQYGSDFVTTSFRPSATSEICFSRDIISELILLISILLLAVSMLN